jgi:hypothetical protein
VALNTIDWSSKVQGDDPDRVMNLLGFMVKVQVAASWLGLAISLGLNALAAFLAYVFADVILPKAVDLSTQEVKPYRLAPEGVPMVQVPAPGYGKKNRTKGQQPSGPPSGDQSSTAVPSAA